MKFGIAWRLGIALALMGVLASGLTGYYGYAESRALLVAAAEERLLTATRVLVRQLSVGLDNVARDVLLIAGHPQAGQLLIRADPRFQSIGERNTALLFERMLLAHPEYSQMRLISAAEYGLERIRVDRVDGGVVRVSGDELQEKGHFPYVFETLRLPPGAVYISRATINHEVGAHAGQGRPSLQVAAPVRGKTGQALGVVVINIDLDGLFAQLATDLPKGLGLYLTNGEGDYLIHPDRSKAFAFDRGQRALVQDSFPDVAALVSSAASRRDQLVTTAPGVNGQGAQVAAFVRQPLTELHGDDDFILGLSQPLAAVLEDSDRLGVVSMRIVVGFSVLAVLLAALLARALTRPLNQIVRAVRNFAAGREGDLLPSARHDEIGLLARTIEDMRQQIRAQFASLEQKQQELDHQACHDSLTGLPNRRLFLERLERAMARAHRNEGKLALLFIDLDNFKQINDTLGHAAGDAILSACGRRLVQIVREVDTVARLGGDEFIILLDGADDKEAIAHVAEKILEVLQQPVVYEDQDLVSGGSIGVGRYPSDGASVTELIAAADRAMYCAKSGGRHRVCFAEPKAG